MSARETTVTAELQATTAMATHRMTMNRTMKVAIGLALSGACAVFVLASGTDAYTIHLLIMSMIWALFATGWNLAAGFGGLKTFGHQAFFAISAYASALLSINYGLSPWMTIWLAAAISALISLVAVAPVLRLRSVPQIAVVTLSFGEIVRILIENLKGLTRGEMGLIGIPPLPTINLPFGGRLVFSVADKTGYFVVILAFLLLAVISVYLLMKSRLGLAILAVRDARDAAESLGHNATTYRVAVFALSAFIVGVAGGFFAHYLLILTPSDSSGTALMVMIVSMSIVGGHGTVLGPVIGAFLLTIGIEAFRMFEDYRLLIFGCLVILVMRLMPEGISRGLLLLVKRLLGPGHKSEHG